MAIVGPVLIEETGTNLSCYQMWRRLLAIDLQGRIHCVYRDIPPWKAVTGIQYAVSEDNGLSWTTEELFPGDFATFRGQQIAVDSSGTIYIVYSDDLLKYIEHPVGGSWSSPQRVVIGFGMTNRTGFYTLDETVRGQTSGAEAKIFDQYWPGGANRLHIFVDPSQAGFQVGEWIRGLSSGVQAKYNSDLHAAIDGLLVDSNDNLQMICHITKCFHAQKIQNQPWTHGERTTLITDGYEAVAIDANNRIHVVQNLAGMTYRYINGVRGAWNPTELFATGTTAGSPFSMCVDLQGNVHVAISQTGLGGVNSGVLNIKYYKRTPEGVWSGPEHVTDDLGVHENPSIAVDRDGNIRVIFHGRGYGTFPLNPNILMQTKVPGGSWAAVPEVLIDRFPAQYAPSMLHSLFPATQYFWGANRPSCPKGWATIFNGQQNATLDVEYLADITQAPSGLLCCGKSSTIDPATGECIPAEIHAFAPYFSAIFNSPDADDTALYYQIKVNSASGSGGTELWDSGKTSMSSVAAGGRCPNITYAGSQLELGVIYYWAIKFWNNDDNDTPWSAAFCFRISLLGPQDLLCEQKQNPIDVRDPFPEFSAIHPLGY